MKSFILAAALLLPTLLSAQSLEPANITGSWINDGAPQRSMIQAIGVRFDRNVSDLIQSGALTVRNVDTGEFIDLSSAIIRFNPKNNSASWIIDRATTALLPDGNYIAWFDSDTLVSERGRAACAASATPLDDFVFGFHQLCGDADGDRDVDFRDSCVLRETWQQQFGNARYLSYFDFNISDVVEEADRTLVANTYFTLFPAEPAIHLFLRNDTGDSFTDNATSLYNIAFDSVDVAAATSWSVQLDAGSAVDITSQVSGGTAILDEDLIDSLNGAPLAVGSHTFRVEARSAENTVLAVDELTFNYLGDVACAPYFITTPPSGVSLGSVRTAIPLSLANWTVENYPGSQGAARWIIAPDGLSARQTVNASPSVLLSPESVLNLRITGTFRVDTNGDDDFMGFVFGYQNRDQFYTFDWKQNAQGSAKKGMSIKRYDRAEEDGPFVTNDFFSSTSNDRFQVLVDAEGIGWKDFQDYKVTLEFTPGRIVVEVFEEGVLLRRLETIDDTFSGGRFGFYNSSQDNVVYSGFTQEKLDNQYFYDSEAEDPDGSGLTYSFANSPGDIPPPATATINAANGTVLWQPTIAGNYPFTIVATDTDGLTDTQTFDVLVTPIDLPPTVVIRKTASSVFPGEEVGIEAISTDDQQLFRTRLFIDGLEVTPYGSESRVSTTRTFSTIGQVELRAIAIDSADQVSETISYIRILDPNTAAEIPNQTPVAPPGSTTGNPTDIRPLVSFQAPLSPADSPARFVGTVDPNGGTIATWFLEWAPASRANPNNLTDAGVLWQQLATGVNPIDAAELTIITPANFPNELIVFRLRAQNTNGLGRITAITFNPRSTANTAPLPQTTGTGSGIRPTASFTAPLGPADDSTMVRANISANGGTLRSWVLDYAPRNSASLENLSDPAVAWTFLERGVSPVSNGLLTTLVPSTLPNAPLVFRITAINESGLGTVVGIVFNPSATNFSSPSTTSGTNPATAPRPVVRITSPRVPADDKSVLIGSVLANGGTLDRYIVDYAPLGSVNASDLSDPVVTWTQLTAGTSEKTAESLADLTDPIFSNGRWVIRLRAFNANGLGSLAATTLDSGDTTVPTVAILSPSPEGDVPYITPVRGSISAGGGVIDSWKLEIAPSSEVGLNNLNSTSAHWTELATGTSEAVDVELGNIDPTALRNGSYILRLRAFNTSGRGTADGLLVHVSGEAKLGNFRLEFDDVTLPLAGIPIHVRRIYDTLDANRSGDFGYGWSLALCEADIRETVPDTGSDFFDATPFRIGTRVFLTTPEGKRVGFTFNVRNPRNRFIATTYDPYFTPDPGVYEQLTIAPIDYMQVEVGEDGAVYEPLLPFGFNPDHYRLTTKDGLVYDYDQRRGLQKITDRNSQTVTFALNAITHSSGQKVDIARDSRGRITTITQPGGATFRYSYDSKGDLVAVTDPAGQATRLTYSPNPEHFLETVANPVDAAAGKFTRMVVYENGRFVRVIDGSGNPIASQAFDPGQFKGTRTDALGNVTELLYDTAGNVLQETSPEGAVTKLEYGDPANPSKETAIIDPNGNRTELHYDARGNPVRLVDGSGQRTEITYSIGNKPTSLVIRNAAGDDLYSLASEYDDKGNLKKMINCKGDERIVSYDAQGRPIEITEFDGSIQRLSYNSPGARQPSTFSIVGGATQEFEFDAAGRPTLQRSSNGETLAFRYDSKGQLVEIQDSKGKTGTYEYDANGNAIRVIDREGVITEMVYDSSNRVIRETKIVTDDGDYGDDCVTEITYDSAGRIIAVMDPLGRISSYEYDKDNRRVQSTDSAGRVTLYSYDAKGNVVGVVDRLDRRIALEYNSRDMLIREEWFAPAGTTPVQVFTREFSELGQPSRLTDGTTILNFEYDCGVVTRQHNAGSVGVPSFDFSLIYDGSHRLTSVTDALGATVLRSFDVDGNLQSLAWSGASLPGSGVAYQHDEFGFVSRLDRFSDTSRAMPVSSSIFTRDTFDGTLLALRHQKPNGQLVAPGSEFIFGHNDSNQVLSQTLQGDNATFTYGEEGQLEAANHLSPDLPDEFYSYDKLGNRIDSHLGGATVVNSLGLVVANQAYSYNYDAENNLILETHISNGTRRSFSYDHRNRLTEIEERDSTNAIIQSTVLTYDPLDRLIGRTIDGIATFTTYLDDNAWMDHAADGSVTARYLFDATVDGLVARWSPSSGVEWMLTDQLKSVRYAIDDGANLTATIGYDSFGNPVIGEADLERLRYGFTGRDYLGGGLHHFRSRVYNSFIGSFLSEDSVGISAGDYNLHRYVSNDPLNLLDPSGNESIVSLSVASGLSVSIGGVTVTVTLKAVLLNALAGAVFQPVIDYLCLSLADQTSRWSWERAARQAGIGAVTGGLGGAIGSALRSVVLGTAAASGSASFLASSVNFFTSTGPALPFFGRWSPSIALIGNWLKNIQVGGLATFLTRGAVRAVLSTPGLANGAVGGDDACDSFLYRLSGGT